MGQLVAHRILNVGPSAPEKIIIEAASQPRPERRPVCTAENPLFSVSIVLDLTKARDELAKNAAACLQVRNIVSQGISRTTGASVVSDQLSLMFAMGELMNPFRMVDYYVRGVEAHRRNVVKVLQKLSDKPNGSPASRQTSADHPSP